ncbi:SufS family cysteine desulfurase [Neiella litorisoli]|uniref:SufS family cysteine desulfurase n=1 Tax=Neiella litorisoli TaxID=2771431 RepID=UPI001CD0E253|nr:SufS family cysteine desulfurase [Neiella litorisoli]
MNKNIRHQFPALQQRINGQPLAYLDSAATSQKPAPVLAAIQHFYRRDNANVHRAGYTIAARATEQFEQARAKVAGYFGMSARNLVWTRGCTEAINFVAYSWALQQLNAGDLLVVSGLEHHANLIPWQQVCRARNAELAIIPVLATGELDQQAFQQLLQRRPKLVALTHVSNVLGTVNPVANMIALAHQYDAKVLIDGAQAAAHLTVDVAELGADFYTFSGHKMYGPTGIGGVLLSNDMLNQCQPWQTGGEMVEAVSYDTASWAQPPHCFEAGTPNIAGAIGLASAVAFLEQLPEDWQQQEAALLAYAQQRLAAIDGIRLIAAPAEQVAVQSFVSDRIHPQDLAQYLDQFGVAVRLGKHCAHPLLAALGEPVTLRLSLGCYSNQQDIDQLIAAIDAAHQGDTETAVSAENNHLDLDEAVAALKVGQSWQQTLSRLIIVGKALPSALKAERAPQYLIHDCESATWLQLEHGESGWQCLVDSEANVVRGMLHLLALDFNRLAVAEQRQFDGRDWLAQQAFFQQLSMTRQSGISAAIEQLQQQLKT